MAWYDRFLGKTLERRVIEITSTIQRAAESRIEGIRDNIRDKYGIGSAMNFGPLSDGRAGGAKWSGGLSRSGGVHYINHYETRMNARKAYHETPQARALVQRYADTVVDLGLVAEPAPRREILGLSMDEAEKWSHNVEESFGMWCKSKLQHRSETMNFYQAQRLYEVFQQRDNDIFVRLYYSDRKDLLNPLQFSFLDPNQIRGNGYTNSYIQMDGDDGIIRDKDGCEKAYRVWLRKIDGEYKGQFKEYQIPAWGPKSGRQFMIHGFTPEYASQGRGYSRLAGTLQEFENLTDFTSAQIKKAINQSNLALWVKPSQVASASNPLSEILTSRGAGPAAREFGSNPAPAPEAQNVDPASPVSFSEIPEARMDVPGSTGIFNLQAGEELKSFENTAPSETFNSFVDGFTSYLAASMGMPIEVLLMRFNSNYSASRAALLLFWRVAQVWREEMASDFLNPVYEIWLAEEIAAGRIICPGWSNPRMRAAWVNVHWIGAPMPNIDPEKTAKAEMLYTELGATTLDRIARDHNGSSGSANRAKLKREIQELSIPPWSQNAAATESSPVTTPESDDDRLPEID